MGKQKINYDIGAIKKIQRGEYVTRAAMSSAAGGSSYSSFNSSVNSAHSFVNSAKALKTKTSTQERNKKTNYYLTKEEKALLVSKAATFSEPGIVPFDVIEDFLYVLCYIEDYDTMKYVAQVTGVVGLDNPGIIREPLSILNVKDLALIGYLANGLAALTKQINATKYTQAYTLQDTDKSAYNTIKKAASSLTTAGQTVTSFPGVSQFSSALGSVTSVVSAVQGLVSTFSTPGQPATKIGQLSSVLSQVTTAVQNIQNVLQIGGQQNIAALFPLMNQINNTMQTVNYLTNSVNTLKNVVSSDSYPNQKLGAVNSKLNTIFNNVTNIATQLSSITSAISSIASPGNVGQPASILLKLTGGDAMGPALAKNVLGQAIPTNIIANNPLMSAPSNIASMLFGAALIPIVAIDQTFKRPIANFKSPAMGAGTAAFQMQNLASMGGSITPQQFISQVVYGVASPVAGSFLSTVVDGQATQVLSSLGAAASSLVEARRSDHAIPMMISIAKTLSNDSGSPFSTNVYAEGWKIASSVGNDLQKTNPQYLKQIQTSA